MKFHVKDMSCGHCIASIETAVSDAGGRATIDLTARSVLVEGLDATRAAQVIRDAGYTAAPL